MSQQAKTAPTAFVIMPFDGDFDAVYERFIVPTLEEKGFVVSRADTQLQMENILRSIIRGINESDLIIADLTIPNANVSYELGLAHALNKPVVLLTEEIGALPFDLRSYRVIEYSTHFARIGPARDQLRDVASGFIDGTITFGSPIVDFLNRPVDVHHHQPGEQAPSSDTLTSLVGRPADDEEPGFIDHVLKIDEGFTEIKSVLEGIAERTAKATDSLSIGSDRIKTLQAQSTATDGRAREQRVVAMTIAQDLNGYARLLATENDRYSAALDSIQPSFEAVLTYHDPTTPEEYETLARLLTAVNTLDTSMHAFRDSTTNTTDTLTEWPNFEKSLNRARTLVIIELRRITGNTDQMSSILSRARNIVQERLEGRP